MLQRRSKPRRSADRSIRSLESLQANASTSRTLNLAGIWMAHGEDPAYKAAPFFHIGALNRAIILKHRLRKDELDLFSDARTQATKVILPIDITDLGAGGRSFFVGQSGYADILDELTDGKIEAGQHDDHLLRLLDRLPSLDPFLMRERLKRAGYAPARCYFDITAADSAKMFQFACSEVSALAGMAFSEMDPTHADRTTKLASKILADAGDPDLGPLRASLSMDPAAFEEGMFCWKGFIYYKWILLDLLPKLKPVASEILTVRPVGSTTPDDRAYIQAVSLRLNKAISRTCRTVRVTLKIYDDAYADLTRNHQPRAFRAFLVQAPTLFYELGDRLGALQHIVSFWRYRFPSGERPRIETEELLDLLADFEASVQTEVVPAAA